MKRLIHFVSTVFIALSICVVLDSLFSYPVTPLECGLLTFLISELMSQIMGLE